ncbi:FliM/FliN family flagellar motor C-terminal domain-containing protein [Hahella aquimaris]|uniref:FliM/FliN family flagellar motor C-terminal domain-containing protein n=1 Tax=Hahella sp. HNIBRBA332 TaxID=3015983 RepID=UPI00273BA3ED|nr:FliM/FliN family flagellar motor C-terminal domain-containing protein [Hahella sp. HNIBRBA332]WLQ15712.1 FliM/FliN family flagellar motor C-terminal domain-containing protein [Hahella sp. HNIBRBA332]
MPVRPYSLWGASLLKRIEAEASACAAAWYGEWVGEDAAVSVSLAQSQDIDSQLLQRVASADAQASSAPGVFVLRADHSEWSSLLLKEKLADEDVSHKLVSRLIKQAVSELMEPWGLAPQGEAEQPSEYAREHASGWLQVTMTWPTASVVLLWSPQVIEKHFSADVSKSHLALKAPEPLLSSCGALAAKLSVRLSSVELTVQEVTSLQVGDVIKLDHKLTDPALVFTQDNALRFKASLGESEGFKSVKLLNIKG